MKWIYFYIWFLLAFLSWVLDLAEKWHCLVCERPLGEASLHLNSIMVYQLHNNSLATMIHMPISLGLSCCNSLSEADDLTNTHSRRCSMWMPTSWQVQPTKSTPCPCYLPPINFLSQIKVLIMIFQALMAGSRLPQKKPPYSWLWDRCIL